MSHRSSRRFPLVWSLLGCGAWGFLITLAAGGIAACGKSSDGSTSHGTGGAGGAVGGTGTAGAATGGSAAGGEGGLGGPTKIGLGIGGTGFNQCGVAAPLPAETGQCTAVGAPALTNFDDYAGGDAASYSYTVAAVAPAANVRGALLHIGDGSEESGSTVTTEMVSGVGDAGFALQIANSNALNWGGLLMFYFPGAAPALPCLDAREYGGLRFSVKGTSPSGRFAVSLGMPDTTPTGDDGLCDAASPDDCKSASVELTLPASADTWLDVELPWSAFTPGVGSGGACIPVTGQNLLRVVIQPLMSYPPPDYAFEGGPYSLAVDDVEFMPADGPPVGVGGAGSGPGMSCDFPAALTWSGSVPVLSPVSDASHDILAVKDPTVVRYNDRWHVFVSTVSSAGAYNMAYTSFADWADAPSAPLYYLDATPGFDTYVAAPEVFYFRPQNKWYLVFQSGPPMYSTTSDLEDPTSWTPPARFYATTPAIITANGGGWLDFWVICDEASCHLFFSDNHGRWYTAKTALEDFPSGFGEPVVVLQDANAGRLFEASNVYKVNGTDQYLALIEAFDQTSDNHRYFRSWIADDLDGPWLPWQASGSFPFAGAANVTFAGSGWTRDISHGDLIRASYDETLAIDPCDLRLVYQGADPDADTGGDYNKIPWRVGVLTQSN